MASASYLRSHSLGGGGSSRKGQSSLGLAAANLGGADGRCLQNFGASRLKLGTGSWDQQRSGKDALRSSTPMGKPEALLARTVAGGVLKRPTSTLSSQSSAWGSLEDGFGKRGGNAGAGRFYSTAPAPRLGASMVEEATGIRLSDDQLHALRKRYQGAGWGESPSSDSLRQEVFSSMVLRPGQWPKIREKPSGDFEGRAASRLGTAPSSRCSSRASAGGYLP
eukprot:TRINITY_DN80890_c0_g1_i1.p1 TRINITY_DN80890_c0_g1~~TRINITY_DN80890_c0_g1_i1.p1  ORF type:complete len:236 (+),score=37.95 TRINITY_DN80890_c0_g1_i1:45-710(+)